ncbi:NAD dependent epimerase/dehydratase family protein [Aphelenchoides bicaudatus]|nr:NAD dependent epimerase/dehydratase family protein [Aphelenchoides bicaudatus]
MFGKVRSLLSSSKSTKMHSVAILGGNSLLGQHVFTSLLNRVPHISVWTPDREFVNRLEDNQNNPSKGVSYFVGPEQLSAAITDCDIVFNLHELQDFSNTPNKESLYKNNVEFVEGLLEICAEQKVATLIHLSSIYLQCSAWWPNVGSRELESDRFVRGNPFPAYFNSKHEAERLVSECETLKRLIVRIGPLYGEGDCCSIICDAIKLSRRFGSIPVIGDLDGAVQFTYAGNAADAVIRCAEQIESFELAQQEIVNISDPTPVKSLFDGVARDCYEAGGNYLSAWTIPFWLFFPLYFLISFLGYLLDFVPYIKNPLADLPSASYVYFMLRQWTFLSDYRLRLLADYKPTYDERESLQRSLQYYGQKLHSDDIKSYSWQVVN